MSEAQLRNRVRHFLRQEAVARSGGDINYNPGLLMGDGIKKKRAAPAHEGNVEALKKWQKHLKAYRKLHPNMSFREQQQKAKASYH